MSRRQLIKQALGVILIAPIVVSMVSSEIYAAEADEKTVFSAVDKQDEQLEEWENLHSIDDRLSLEDEEVFEDKTEYTPKNDEYEEYEITYILPDDAENNLNNPNFYTCGEEVVLQEPTREGYTFVGWYTSTNYKTKVTQIKPGTKGNKTFYAKWSPIKYTISYVLNGGKNASTNPRSYNITSKDIKLKNPTRKGYTFTGWYEDEYLSESCIYDIPKGSSGDIILYASWETTEYDIVYHNVTEEGNVENNVTSYNIESDNIIISNPTRDGYKFAGWYLNSKFKTKLTDKYGQTLIKSGSTGHKNLYAKWTVIKYPFSYHLGGGKNHKSNPQTYSINTKDITLKAPTRKGYNFLGWYDNADYDGEQITTVYKGSFGNREFHAKWEPIDYTVTFFNVTEEEAAINSLSTYTIEDEDQIIATPTREGYTFAGWYLDSKYKNKLTAKDGTTRIKKGSTGNKKLYAKWVGNTYYVYFLKNNDYATGRMSKMKCTYGKTYKLPANTFKLNGSKFNGWTVWYSDDSETDDRPLMLNNKESFKNLSKINNSYVYLCANWIYAIDFVVENNLGYLPVEVNAFRTEYDSFNDAWIERAITTNIYSMQWNWTKYSWQAGYNVTLYLDCQRIDESSSNREYCSGKYIIRDQYGIIYGTGTIYQAARSGETFVETVYLFNIPKGVYYITFQDY